MKIAIFGLSISSSWGNGHATLWRGLLRALVDRGHKIAFFERDVPYYAQHRDLTDMPGVELVLYPSWEDVWRRAERCVRDSDVAMITSYCPDSRAAAPLVLSSPALKVFYDLDAPVTLDRLTRGEDVDYVPQRGYADFDLVMSYTGGLSLEQLESRLGARKVIPIYGSVDPEVHRPVCGSSMWAGDLSYLGTYATDRQDGVNRFFVEPARRRPELRFVMGGAMYDQTFPWTENIFFYRHIAPADHPLFYSSSRATLNVTRAAMAASGFCPSGRLFEAAACGTPILTDVWDGLGSFFHLGEEIIPLESTQDVLRALDASELDLARIAMRGRERTLSEHTSAHRAIDFENALNSVRSLETAGAGN
jgi:spore maturation protein CgeB